MLGLKPDKFSHVAFGLVPKVFDPIDMIFLFGKQLGMINALGFEPQRIQNILATPVIRIDNAVRLDIFLNDPH